MNDATPHRRLFHNRFAADAVGANRMRAGETCFRQPGAGVRFHAEREDTSSAGWRRLLDLIDQAAADGREVFRPLVELTPEERADLVTLPPTIAKLTRVKHFVLYGQPLGTDSPRDRGDGQSGGVRAIHLVLAALVSVRTD